MIGLVGRLRLAALLLSVAGALVVSDARAQEDDEDADELDLEIEFKNDELPAAVHPLTSSLFYGAEVELELISELNPRSRDDGNYGARTCGLWS